MKTPRLKRIGKPSPHRLIGAMWWAESRTSIGCGVTPEEAIARWWANLPPPLRWWRRASEWAAARVYAWGLRR